MSYEKNEWQTGDVITANKLNHIEEGVGDINVSYDKTTWQTGDVITAVKLNNIEDGIDGSDAFAKLTWELDAGNGRIVLDRSYNGVLELVNNDKYPYFIFTEEDAAEIISSLGFDPFTNAPAIIGKKIALIGMYDTDGINVQFEPIGVIGYNTSYTSEPADKTSNLVIYL